MKKLTLDVEQPRVPSFAAADAANAGAGTVRGLAATVTGIYPRCGTAAQRQSCDDGCTCGDC